jgi:hypothetical protein
LIIILFFSYFEELENKRNGENYMISPYEILANNVIAGVTSQEILNIITFPKKINKQLYFYDSFSQKSDCIDYLLINKKKQVIGKIDSNLLSDDENCK